MKQYLLNVFIVFSLSCSAQDSKNDTAKTAPSDSAINQGKHSSEKKMFRPNDIKINVYCLLMNSYSVFYERVISKKMSVQIGYRYQPYGYLLNNLPGRKLLESGAVEKVYEDFKISNYAVTADIRLYTGKKSKGAKGIFLGLYGRYAHFDIDNVDYTFETENGTKYSVPIVSNISGGGVGFSTGIKWVIKKRVSVELFSGVQYQKFNGILTSKKDLKGLSDQEKMTLQESLEDLFTIGEKKYLTSTINNSGITGSIKGPTIGIRSGLSIGIIF